MTLVQTILSVILAVMFVVCVLFVIFGQITVRKLRKNPETRQVLGLELASGFDILNVAQALALPKTVTQRIKHNSMSIGLRLQADSDVLYKHTTVFDRLLARVFYWLWISSAFSLIMLMMLNWLGIFD